MEILARLMSNGWATRPPVITEIFVLSEDKIVPKRVAFSGSASYTKIVHSAFREH